MTWSVWYGGEEIIKHSFDPELDACRELLRRGITGKVMTYRYSKPCMVLGLGKAAQYRTTTDKEGTPVFRKVRGAESASGT